MLDSRTVNPGDSLFDSSMSRFTFIYEEGNSKVSHSFHNIFCPEIIENFKHFMQGCGFFESNLMASMGAMVEEYEMLEEKRAKSSFPD